MLARGPSEDSAERVVVVVVTKKDVRKLALGLLGTVLLSFSLSNCGVASHSTSTPNAFVCNPQGTDVANFSTTVYANLGANGCLNCHGNQPVTPAPLYRNRMRFNTDIAQTTAEQTEDLCIAYMFGQLSPSTAIVTHPQDAKHDGGQFQASDIQPIINWVNTYRLPPPPQ